MLFPRFQRRIGGLAALFGLLGGSLSCMAAETPYLDAVEQSLRELAPRSEGSVWQRTQGNHIRGREQAPWLLQTPDCWGAEDCSQSTATQAMADAMYQDIAAATTWVDITTLITYPDGVFQDAIVRGLKEALTNNPNLIIRVLGGTPPGLGNFSSPISESAHDYLKRLNQDLGEHRHGARLIVAGVETSWLYSWNHSKIIAVDGKSSIVGGHNLWEGAYGLVDNPISDISMRLEGPAARASHQFADLLWDFACTYSGSIWNSTFYVDLARGDGLSKGDCPAQHYAPESAPAGNVAVMALGGLGFGMTTPGGDHGGLAAAKDSKAACSRLFKDYFNNDSEFSVANPEVAGIRALIESANHNIRISQQDLMAPCAPPISNAYYDARLFNVLAKKLIDGVKLQIVVSTPGAKQGLTAPYSNMKKMSEITDVLVRKIKQLGNMNREEAENLMCQHLQLAPMRIESGVGTWANGNSIANHSKTVMVDDAAFYIGSKNLYPTTLQDFGFIIEDATSAQEYIDSYWNQLWGNSKSAATVDFEANVCNL
ncbi:phospholipase D-like domain-containing protein [Pleionea sp. CnH1-48]|uniref:phospholipase D-like domain-containing protein n=1 Tax=Pleionea sp. CnH1-48 TaxID=2954494 RepID=UPI002096E6B5|nr:phospholipase D-like domain-containing protein [Pleionea sp. CnH1-48]MCO7224928.1 phospholipase D-like domain-containing protein [Pleionea sp. CnH1-48]